MSSSKQAWDAKLFFAAIFAAVTVTLAIVHLICFNYGAIVRQTHRDNFLLAERVAPRIEKSIQSDARFADVRVGGWTGGGGMIYVVGSVVDESHLPELKRAVHRTNPQLPVKLRVRVFPEPGRRSEKH